MSRICFQDFFKEIPTINGVVMIKSKHKPVILGALMALVVLLCFQSSAISSEPGVTQKYKSATSPLNQSVDTTVTDLPKHTVQVSNRYQGGRFWTETRKEKMERFKCSQCHNNQPVTIANAAKTAHGDVALKHGSKDKQLSCFTCHNREARDELVSEGGERVDMDHSYELCGQCHFRQKKDWVGGAHGKRIGYWTGKRVVKTCTSCHNPHSPRFEKRWPVTYSSPTAK